jgi:quinoprotein glucose dehydrogenase
MTFHRGDLYVATLGSEALVRIGLEGGNGGYEVTSIERLFARDWSDGEHGRLRDVVEGPDGNLYVLTSNRDGRGRPREGDDRILRLVPRG